MARTWRREMAATLTSVDTIAAEAKAFVAANLPAASWKPFAFELVLREALNNAVIHGADDQSAASMRLEIELGAEAILIMVHTPGGGYRMPAWTGLVRAPMESGRGLSILLHYCETVELGSGGKKKYLRLTLPLLNRTSTTNPPRTMSSIKTLKSEDQLIILIQNDLIASGAAELRATLRELLADASSPVVVDLNSVEIVDSTGIGVLISLYNSLKEKKLGLSVVGASADVLELFQSMRLDRHFPVSGRG